MKVIKLGEQLNTPIVLCLGFFGSMHKGHLELLNRAKRRAKMTNGKVALFTFSNNHLAVLKRETTVLYTYEERLTIYESLGVDYVISATFDDDFKRLTGKEFLLKLNEYNLQSVFCGFDHCCGRDRMDALSIRKYFNKISGEIPVYIVEQINVDDEKVSTSLLRDCITSNRLEKANSLLSEPFFIEGVVSHGRGIGKTLGFPTANLDVPDEKLLPCGVFSATVSIKGVTYRAIVNIGDKPTFDIARRTVEIHILDFNENLYGQVVKASLLKYLRPIIKFESAAELSRQLEHDKEEAAND